MADLRTVLADRRIRLRTSMLHAGLALRDTCPASLLGRSCAGVVSAGAALEIVHARGSYLRVLTFGTFAQNDAQFSFVYFEFSI